MGGALAGAISKNLNTNIYISDNNKTKAEELAAKINGKAADNYTVASSSELLFIGVKPGIVPLVAKEIAEHIKAETVIVSMAAGVNTQSLLEYFGNKKKIIRIMPNTPVKVGSGMTAYAVTDSISPEDEEKFLKIMEPTGSVDKLPEALIDAACAVAGCGPAFVYMFIEALADGGVCCGLPREKALLYAAETVKGAAKTVIETGEHPEALKDAVCSPGGSTIEGVAALEEGGLRVAAINAVKRAFEKTKRLG